MNNIVKTIADIHPEKLYVTSEQYKTFKNKRPRLPFEIKNESIAQQLIIIGLIKKEEKKIHIEHKNDSEDWGTIFEETGKYILTPEGEYYLDYRKNKDKTHRLNEIRAWITLIIAIAGFCLSVYSIYLNHIANIK